MVVQQLGKCNIQRCETTSLTGGTEQQPQCVRPVLTVVWVLDLGQAVQRAQKLPVIQSSPMFIFGLHKRHVNIRWVDATAHAGNPVVRVQQPRGLTHELHEIAAVNRVLLALLTARQPVRAVVKEHKSQLLVVGG